MRATYGLVTSVALTALAALSCTTSRAMPDTQRGPAIGARGMVSTAHPIATEAGLEVLRAGGNAFDAAVAVAATLGVVEPMMSGIGGYGTILVHHAGSDRTRFLNASSHIPFAVDAEVYRAPTPGHMQNRRGAKAVSTPGNVHAWEALSREYGTRPWPELFGPAIRAARDGFNISERTAEFIADAYGEFPAHAQAIYGRDGVALAAGDRLVQRDLARSLQRIASEGASAVYGGALGAAIDRTMRDANGFLAMADLVADSAEWWDPISVDYRGHRVYTASPPANSFDALQRLGVMARFDNRALGHNTAAYLHRYAEVTKLGFWMRLRHAGDPAVAPPPVAALLSADSLDRWAARIDTARASAFVPPGVSASTGLHTTHFVVADRWGNVVSATQTLGNAFGARIMPEGTGIWLNNSLAYSTFEPAGNAMDAFPGRRKLSGDVPAIVMRDGRPWIAIGTPGGHTIGQTVPQMIMNVIDFGMSIDAAIAAPRISFAEPNVLVVEPGVPAAVRAELAARGHELRVPQRPSLGNGHGLTIEWDRSGKPVRFTGGADPRGEGVARGM